ncbi:MAG: hypothetical protein K8R21_15455 [Leptospira sp.]|nr:hypothetical protein [Leptospira sp.]
MTDPLGKDEREEPDGSLLTKKSIKIQKISVNDFTDTFLGTLNKVSLGLLSIIFRFCGDLLIKTEIFAGLLSLEPSPWIELNGKDYTFGYGESV